MLLVHDVTGPPTARVGELATYRVGSFSEPDPSPQAVAGVRWLIKGADGGVLAHITQQGPELRLTIPEHWAGQVVLVMAYIKTPSANVAHRTSVEARVEAHAGTTRSEPRHVDVVRESGRYYASVDGEPRFYVGTDVRYGTRRGLMNGANPPGPRYKPQEFEAAHGDWAWYLFPTITCESHGHFTCLNTYDRASFTFGHIQLAAHTPDDNFVLFFRELLNDPAASEYFPELRLSNGRIHLLDESGLAPLESAASTSPLMSYLNPRADRVDEKAAEKAARLVDWSVRHASMRDQQVAFAVRQQRRKLREHAARLPLDGTVDKLCLVVLDILHQGRASYGAIGKALAANDPFDALLSLGAAQYRERVATLRAGIRDLEASGKVGAKVFDVSSGDFVVPEGA